MTVLGGATASLLLDTLMAQARQTRERTRRVALVHLQADARPRYYPNDTPGNPVAPNQISTCSVDLNQLVLMLAC
jgi:hypothetical protein